MLHALASSSYVGCIFNDQNQYNNPNARLEQYAPRFKLIPMLLARGAKAGGRNFVNGKSALNTAKETWKQAVQHAKDNAINPGLAYQQASIENYGEAMQQLYTLLLSASSTENILSLGGN